VPGQNHPRRVDEPATGRTHELRESVDGRGDVVERARPATAALTTSTVLRSADNEPGTGQGLSERRSVLAPVLRAPETAMQEYGERSARANAVTFSGLRRRQMNVRYLVGTVSVA
jgi:hypothetical protein